jgi:hypothetical protein
MIFNLTSGPSCALFLFNPCKTQIYQNSWNFISLTPILCWWFLLCSYFELNWRFMMVINYRQQCALVEHGWCWAMPSCGLGCGGSYESSCDTSSWLSVLVCCYHLEVVWRLVDAADHRAVDVYYLSKTSIRLLLLLRLWVFTRYLFGWVLLRKL